MGVRSGLGKYFVLGMFLMGWWDGAEVWKERMQEEQGKEYDGIVGRGTLNVMTMLRDRLVVKV